MRDKLQIIGNGASMTTQIPSVPNDGRVATVYVTIPVRFRGGALVVRDPDGSEERYTVGVEGALISSGSPFWPTASTRLKPFTTATSYSSHMASIRGRLIHKSIR